MKSMKFLSALSAIAAVTVFSSFATARQLNCKGTDLRLSIVLDANQKAVGVTGIWAKDATISEALKQSSQFDGPETTNDVQLPDYIQASFPTPNGYYPNGTWTLSLNPKTGEAVFGYNDFDGDIRSLDLICR